MFFFAHLSLLIELLFYSAASTLQATSGVSLTLMAQSSLFLPFPGFFLCLLYPAKILRWFVLDNYGPGTHHCPTVFTSRSVLSCVAGVDALA